MGEGTWKNLGNRRGGGPRLGQVHTVHSWKVYPNNDWTLSVSISLTSFHINMVSEVWLTNIYISHNKAHPRIQLHVLIMYLFNVCKCLQLAAWNNYIPNTYTSKENIVIWARLMTSTSARGLPFSLFRAGVLYLERLICIC